jgi:hypothetical protein
MWDVLDDAQRDDLRSREQDATLTGRVVTADDIGTVAVERMKAAAHTAVVVPIDGGRHLRPI